MISYFMVSLGFTSIRAVCVCVKEGSLNLVNRRFGCDSRKGFFFPLPCGGKFIALNLIVRIVEILHVFLRLIGTIIRIIKDSKA